MSLTDLITPVYVKIGLIVALIAMVIGGVAYWDHGIKKQQINVDQNVQLKQALKDIDDLKKKTDALDSAQADIIEQLNQKNAAVKTKSQSVQSYINSPAAQKSNRESSDILKETIRRLSNDQ